MGPRRYAICGLSNRAIHEYALPLLGNGTFVLAEDDYSRVGTLVAIVDVDPARTAAFLERTGSSVPFYLPDDFERMVDETAPDCVVVAGPDFTHERFAVAALNRGLDAIVEKPLANSVAGVRAILAAEAASSGRVTVAHNARYEPAARRVKELVREGAIGTVLSVDLVEGIDTYHGSSFFRRWNRVRANSGGLAVTKGCHTLDLVAWILADPPTEVVAHGGRAFYGANGAHRPRGLDGAPLDPQSEAALNPYAQRWQRGRLPNDQELFTGQWQEIGYPAQYPVGVSRGIFDAEIDVEDHYSALIRFASGASMTYSLCFSMPWEGYRLGITGTHGRIETELIAYRHLPESTVPQRIRVDRLFGPSELIDVESEPGGHDGADARIRRDLFLGQSEASVRDGIQATALHGAIAVATGEAMWRSVDEGRAISVATLMGVDRMPAWDAESMGGQIG